MTDVDDAPLGDPVTAILAELAGAASVCWSNIDGAGTFDADAATAFVSAARARLDEIGSALVAVASGDSTAGIRVTVTPLDGPDDGAETVLEDDYALVCAGTCEVASVTAHDNGTHVITVKGVGGRT